MEDSRMLICPVQVRLAAELQRRKELHGRRQQAMVRGQSMPQNG